LNEANSILKQKKEEFEKLTKLINRRKELPSYSPEDEKEEKVDQPRIREAKALRYANETLQSLQIQIKEKDKLIDKYRNMIQDVREELAEKTVWFF
jgi:hypothetical protein